MKPYLLPVLLQVIGILVVFAEIFIPSFGLLAAIALALFSYSLYLVFTTISSTAGLVFAGLDLILVPVCVVFGMKILACAHTVRESPVAGVKMIDMDTLFRESDIVSLHCPLTAENKGFINKSRLEMMKRNSFLINTSRGPLIDEQSLADALNSGRIAGAGLDVLSSEPPKSCNPLLNAKNCIITPHIAWATRSARERLMKIAVGNVKAFIDGKPANVVK